MDFDLFSRAHRCFWHLEKVVWASVVVVSLMVVSAPVDAEEAVPKVHNADTVHAAKLRPWWIVRREDLVIPNEPRIGKENDRAWIMALLSIVEPYRFVPAEEWHSPYCLNWDDGSIQCKRKKADDPPNCMPITYVEVKHALERQVIECTSFDKKKLENICATTLTNTRSTYQMCEADRSGFQCNESYPVADREAAASVAGIWPRYERLGEGFAPLSSFTASRGTKNQICVEPLWSAR